MAAAEDLLIDNFEGGDTVWTVDHASSIDTASTVAARTGSNGMRWRFQPDGVNQYGNSVEGRFNRVEPEEKQYLLMDVFANGSVLGRIGCQLLSGEETETNMGDIHTQVLEGEWVTVSIPIPEEVSEIDGVRIFFDGSAYLPSEPFECYIDNIRLSATEAVREVNPDALAPVGPKAEAFSRLPLEQQMLFRLRSAAKPLSERVNPYSTPMYYPQWGGGSPDGTQRSDIQEAIFKEFAELGMTKIHFNWYPEGVGTETINFTISEQAKVGIKELTRLSKESGLKVGLRLDPPYQRMPEFDAPGKDPAVSYWISHPRNPDNKINDFCQWIRDVLLLFNGQVDYVILGDEMGDYNRGGKEDWSTEDYMNFLKPCVQAVREIVPDVKVSGYAASSSRFQEILELVKAGYGEVANAVAFNHYDYNAVAQYMAELKELNQGESFALLSNGVGYISSDTKVRNPPTDPYSRYTNKGQADMIARTMFSWWLNDAHVAPYYVSMRELKQPGNDLPYWYGFFGYMDLVLDENSNPSFTRYPGWYAFRTVANVFDSRPDFAQPDFQVTLSSTKDVQFHVLERNGRDLTLMLWEENSVKSVVDIAVDTPQYKFPVQINLLNHQKFTDVPAAKTDTGILLRRVQLSAEPAILRLFYADDAPSVAITQQ